MWVSPDGDVEADIINLSAGYEAAADIDTYIEEHPDISPEARHLLSMGRVLKVDAHKEETPDAKPETVTLSGQQAEEYRDYQISRMPSSA